MGFRARVSTDFDETTLVEDGRDKHFGMNFHSGIPKENRVDNSRLAERALLQGGKSGLLDDRVSVTGKKVVFP